MSDSVELPPIQVIIDLHSELLATHGGAPGLRSLESLEAALARPKQVLAYASGDVTVCGMAAALCIGICRIHHPFVDGNKRAALLALGLTLGLNGFHLDVSEREAASTIEDVAAGKMSEGDFEAWVVRNSFTLPEAGPPASGKEA